MSARLLGSAQYDYGSEGASWPRDGLAHRLVPQQLEGLTGVAAQPGAPAVAQDVVQLEGGVAADGKVRVWLVVCLKGVSFSDKPSNCSPALQTADAWGTDALEDHNVNRVCSSKSEQVSSRLFNSKACQSGGSHLNSCAA